MEFTRMNAEQMRRKAIQNSKEKEQQSKDYQNQIDNMSKHSTGNLYDVRAIIKSKTEQKLQNHFSVQQAEEELENFLQSNRLYTMKNEIMDYIKKVTPGTDSYNVRETGKIFSSFLNKIKEVYEIKD